MIRALPARRVAAFATVALATMGLALFPGRAPGQDAKPSLDAFRAKVKTAMADVRTTRGKFHQTKKLALFDDKVESSGTFAIERPDHIRWEIEQPFRSILVIAGDKGARWNETRQAVERFSLADKPGIDVAVKQLFSWYSGGFDEASSQFDVNLEGERTVTLVPKNEKVRDVLSKIGIRLAPSLATIESIELDEKEGDRTDIVFSDVKTNEAIDPKTFEIADR